MMAQLEKLEQRMRDAEKALNAEVNKQFPVGTPVAVATGRGWMYGEVAYECDRNGYVKVRSRTGRIHHKYYGDVERVG